MSLEIVGTVIFALAVLHTFSTSFFERLAHRSANHAGFWHLLAEVEIVFGVWTLLLFGIIAAHGGVHAAMRYVEDNNFTEPIFVFVIMVVASSKPVLDLASMGMLLAARLIPARFGVAFYITALTLGPLLGSLITEPAAMTLTALILYANFFSRGMSERFKYATVALLFVNVSIGGVLTNFAAPPVVMVAHKWGLSIPDMFLNYGWKALLAICINTLGAVALFRQELEAVEFKPLQFFGEIAPLWVSAVHLGFLAAVVAFSHHPYLCVGTFLFFLGFVEAYQRYQNELLLRNALLVAFFLSGLIIIGKLQTWWLTILLRKMDSLALFVGATLLTGITDNAALTYLGSLVEGITDVNKYALLSGAVTGGGLTVIANAPNPAGYSILKGAFEGEHIGAGKLAAAATLPTFVAALCFYFLPSLSR